MTTSNYNHNDSRNGSVNGYVNGEVNGYVNGEVNTLTPSQKLVYDTVNNNPGIQTKQIADVLKRSPRTIEKAAKLIMKALKAKDPSHFKVLCKSVNVDETVDFS